jgi:hypothetical protein
MRKYSLIVYFIFVVNIINSQEVNYISYYHLVNKAKIAQCQNNYDSAISYYLQAFKLVDYILQDDMRNFSYCAAIEEKDSLIYFAMEQCIKQIIPLSFIFVADSIFDKYKHTNKWQWCMEQEQANAEKYKEKCSCPYTKVLDSLLISDQRVRNRWNWFCRIFPKSRIAQKRLQEWWLVDSSNRVVIDELVAKYDYPNERNGCVNHYLLDVRLIVLYHYGDTNFFYNIESKALIEGKMSPSYYADKARRISRIFNIPELKYTYHKEMTEKEKTQVDKNRYGIGLPSIEEAKLMYQCNREKYLKSKKDKKKKRR